MFPGHGRPQRLPNYDHLTRAQVTSTPDLFIWHGEGSVWLSGPCETKWQRIMHAAIWAKYLLKERIREDLAEGHWNMRHSRRGRRRR